MARVGARSRQFQYEQNVSMVWGETPPDHVSEVQGFGSFECSYSNAHKDAMHRNGVISHDYAWPTWKQVSPERWYRWHDVSVFTCPGPLVVVERRPDGLMGVFSVARATRSQKPLSLNTMQVRYLKTRNRIMHHDAMEVCIQRARDD
ncbi:hypothetical protein HBI79_075640 [Parastagonospora nodorum]|nr:hypothetical protein HBI79_075640 [Parastagonospora nodorum]